MSKSILPEKQITLTSVEIEVLLYDVHNRLAELLTYVDNSQKHLAGSPENWVRLRVNTLRALATKLEEAAFSAWTE